MTILHFGTVDITAESAADFQQLSIFTELQNAHSTLLDDYDYAGGGALHRRQPVLEYQAGAFLNAVPSRRDFRISTWALRIAVQRRLGLPLDEALARGYHSTRRSRGARRPARRAAASLLAALAKVMRSVWGMLVEFKNPLSSNPEDVGQRGAFVGLGNTEPGTSADVFGLEQRGAVGDGDFRPSDGGGYEEQGRERARDRALAYQGGAGGDYRYAREDKGVDVQLLLFESFGGFGKGVREILRKAADVLQNKLTRAQYLDEVTWTTKNWLGLHKQRISVVLHTAIAEQVVNELACGGGGRVHGAKCLATLAGVA
ncbi:hypothetical protein EMIHUDRAFT_251615 [Emiliania huxleyi CCMP1516]|uniref:Uncharacterized protein n=2 Tax=Emiliania huxleyi TaxID=2903 RepID=A0A0D3KSY0_EMIH1|nr:hypothetical protein EMIHUDRAFT_251615 [Emiliania huxleyi CCMP1516]EOD38865.1 hypothetical protein EMIHUDRAFT_251615 [Emiliania huxleyi CCMP1516]|eukprot:XP_005791294.1 hypothetical protein EMIHUDRAFT_251615 [Emiliania huxleyi CCMP1516]